MSTSDDFLMELRIDPNYCWKTGRVYAGTLFCPFLGTLRWCDTLTGEKLQPLFLQTNYRSDGMKEMMEGARRIRDLLNTFLACETEYNAKIGCFVVKERDWRQPPQMGFRMRGWDL